MIRSMSRWSMSRWIVLLFGLFLPGVALAAADLAQTACPTVLVKPWNATRVRNFYRNYKADPNDKQLMQCIHRGAHDGYFGDKQVPENSAESIMFGFSHAPCLEVDVKVLNLKTYHTYSAPYAALLHDQHVWRMTSAIKKSDLAWNWIYQGQLASYNAKTKQNKALDFNDQTHAPLFSESQNNPLASEIYDAYLRSVEPNQNYAGDPGTPNAFNHHVVTLNSLFTYMNRCGTNYNYTPLVVLDVADPQSLLQLYNEVSSWKGKLPPLAVKVRMWRVDQGYGIIPTAWSMLTGLAKKGIDITFAIMQSGTNTNKAQDGDLNRIDPGKDLDMVMGDTGNYAKVDIEEACRNITIARKLNSNSGACTFELSTLEGFSDYLNTSNNLPAYYCFNNTVKPAGKLKPLVGNSLKDFLAAQKACGANNAPAISAWIPIPEFCGTFTNINPFPAGGATQKCSDQHGGTVANGTSGFMNNTGKCCHAPVLNELLQQYSNYGPTALHARIITADADLNTFNQNSNLPVWAQYWWNLYQRFFYSYTISASYFK